MSEFITIIVLVFVGFVLFCIYFFFKCLQFVISAINLYNKIINREDAIIKLLIDIRDNTRNYSEGNLSDHMTTNITDSSNADSEKFFGTGRKCPECNYIFHGDYDKEGWWCPNCENVRDNET